MAAPEDAIAFLELAERSKLLSHEQVAAAIARFGFKPDQTPKQVAVILVKARLLSRFQASQLLKGRHRGFVIDGYKLLEILGAGGMGMVYIAVNIESGDRIALKLLTEGSKEDAGVRARFEMEARAGMMLDHPQIVRTFKFGRSEDVDYIVMELIEAISLEEMIRQEKRVAYPQACSILCQAARGLEHAHDKGMIHRDVKPANLLVDRAGEVKILDFGLALVEDNEDSEFALARIFGQDRLGTADYTAPEQTLDSYTIDTRADIYSLGCTFYTTLVGQVPFPYNSNSMKLAAHRTKRPRSVKEFAPDVPDKIARIVERMMAKEPDGRFATMAEVYAALEPMAKRKPVSFDLTKVLAERVTLAKRRAALMQKRKQRAGSSASWVNRGLSSGATPSGMDTSGLTATGSNLSSGLSAPEIVAGKIVIRHVHSGDILLEIEAESLVGADLSRAQLAGANLLAIDLSGAQLNHANLRDADLRRANLTDARLTGCVLNDANLEEAVLLRAALYDASLGGCKFAGANLTQADLRRADLNGADFSRADLTGADLSMAVIKANLQNANLACADLRGSTFAGSNLTGANLDGANLTGANFRGAIGPTGQPVFTATLK